MKIKGFYLKYHYIVFPLLLPVVFYIYYNLSFKDKMKIVDRQLAEAKKQQELINLWGEKLRLEGELSSLTVKFGGRIDYKWLMTIISEIANKERIEITTVKPLPVKEMKFYKSLSVALNLEGSYHQIGKMVADIENAQYYLKVDKLTLSPEIKEKDGKKFRAMAKDGNTLLKCEMIVSSLIPSI